MTTDFPPTDADTARRAFDRLVAGEPESGLDPGAAARQGRRIRRQHRARVALPGTVLGLVGLTALAMTTLGGQGGNGPAGEPASPELSLVAASAPLTEAGRQAVAYSTQVDPDTGDLSYRIDPGPVLGVLSEVLDDDGNIAVRRSDWGSWDATVTSGAERRGGISFAVTAEPGMLTVNPCGDPEFVDGGTCTRTVLPDGSYLNERGVVEHDGLRSIVVSITRDDGTGVFVEANNFVIEGLPDAREAVDHDPDAKDRIHAVAVTERTALTMDQARDLVFAVERSGEIGTFPRRS